MPNTSGRAGSRTPPSPTWRLACHRRSKPHLRLRRLGSAHTQNGSLAKVDKSLLAIPELKRVRSKEHLRFVAGQPCLICSRTPAQAHHIRYAQAKGIALKVSDEFTVPLCAIHHSENHATGDERRWWQERKIDPLAIAHQLWAQSRPRAENATAREVN